MKNFTLIIFVVFIFGGGFAAYYGLTHEIQPLTGLGLVGLSIGLILIGTKDILVRESTETDDLGNTTTYRGWSAVLVGVFWIVLGIILFITAIAVIFGQQENLFLWALERPGFALIVFGFAAVAYGGHTLIGSEEEKSSALSFFGSLPGRIFALIILVCGLVMITAGAVEILFPALFYQWIAAMQDWQQDLKCQINPYYCGE